MIQSQIPSSFYSYIRAHDKTTLYMYKTTAFRLSYRLPGTRIVSTIDVTAYIRDKLCEWVCAFEMKGNAKDCIITTCFLSLFELDLKEYPELEYCGRIDYDKTFVTSNHDGIRFSLP